MQQHLVGESSTTDSNSSKDTVALVLVHDQTRLNTSGLLVGVRHHATDEVGLGLVEGGHQVVELALEVGGDGLAALPLLPVLVLWGLQGLSGMIRKALNSLTKKGKNIISGGYPKFTKSLPPFLISSTMVSLRGSLFFSSHPVKL